MDIVGELDLEDIESRLYSQVFHSNCEETDSLSLNNLNENSLDSLTKRYRYFVPNSTKSREKTNANNTISITQEPNILRDTISNIQESSSIPNSLHSQKNISSSLNSIRQCLNQTREKVIRRSKRILKNKVSKSSSLNTITVYISDSDTEDCIDKDIEINMDTGFPKKYNEAKDDSPPEPDDDIIFIPPPPVEVINIDIDEKTQDNGDSPQLVEILPSPIETPESNVSNDFLENSNLDTNHADFNFDLHGSEFNSMPVDFQKSQKPTDYCETESSCSTNDQQSRNFSNTVKTIVFDEIDFPKEDIFSEKNLESFSSFITPKRCPRPKQVSTQKTKEPIESSRNDNNSDASSSESDYDVGSKKKKENLPDLSPMVPVDIPSKRPKTKQSKIVNEEIINDVTSTPNEKPKKKKKKDSSQIEDENTELVCSHTEDKEKTKRKKKKNLSISEDETAAKHQSINENPADEILEKSKKKKKKRDNSLTDTESTTDQCLNIITLDQSQTTDDNSNLKKKKKKRENSENSNKEEENIEEGIDKFIKDVQITADLNDSLPIKKKRKKKKNKENSNTTLEVSGNSIQGTTILSKSKNKKKKKDKSEDSISRIELELLLKESKLVNDYIVLDSDDSSKAISLSSDSDNDYEVLDDVGEDLSINCSSTNNSENINVSETDLSKTIETTPLPLKDYEQFDVETIQRSQSDDPNKWQISYKDRAILLYQNKGTTNRTIRCNRCRQLGHFGIRCPDKKGPPPCTLCGMPDHQEPRCPNKRCLQCGNPGNYSTVYCHHCFKFRNSVCSLCRMPGHVQKFCPDLWRRYHMTNEGPIIISTENGKPRLNQWCSGCAKRGHLEHECDYYNRQFPPTTPFVMNYTDVLNQDETPQINICNTPNVPVHNPTAIQEKSINVDNVPTTVNIPSLLHLPPINPPPINPQFTNTLNFIPLQGIPASSTSTMSHSLPPNMTIQVANNPPANDIYLQMMLNFNNKAGNQANVQNIQPLRNEANQTSHAFHNQQNPPRRSHIIDLYDSNRIRHFIMNSPSEEVFDFIQDEIDFMNSSNIDPRVLKSKLLKYDRIIKSQNIPKNIEAEKNHWMRIIHMYIFGINKNKGGRLHVKYLNAYLAKGRMYKLDVHKRRALLSSYSYVFGSKERNIDYYRIIRSLFVRKLPPKRL